MVDGLRRFHDVEMSLASEAGAFELFYPAMQLSRYEFGLLSQFCQVRFVIGECLPRFQYPKHRPNFASRTAGDIEEREQLVVGPAFKTFGYVVGN